jgi:RNA polymerase sigma-70 factor (ECF subfamily)
LYTPLLYSWCRRAGLSEADAAELVQEVFVVLLDKIDQFEPRADDGRPGKFRSWLRTVTLNKWRDFLRRRREEPLEPNDAIWQEIAAPPDAERLWQAEHDHYVARRALEIMRAEFSEAQFKACWETTVNGRTVAEVAAELGMSVGALYVAKSRVLMRLREELAGLCEE